MARLIVISNRVAMPSQPGQASAGGLTMALAAALQEYKGVWFGWSGETTKTFDPTPKITETSGVTVATIDLEEQDVQEYYNGYANKTLWPLFHHRIDLTAYERSFTEGYGRVNARFAQSVLPLIEPDDLIWVHDYHLIPLARELRRMGVKNRIGFFLHIPFPAWELLVTLPRHRELVESLFDYDLVGFHTEDWLRAFQTYVEEEADGRVHKDGLVTAFGRTIAARAFPIGIDAENFANIARSANAVRSYNRVAATGVYRTTMVGVDRIDYSKGLEERFLAFEQFLADNPEAHERVSMLQIAQSSRGEVDAYQELQARLDALTGRINAAYTAVDWTPIRYVNRSYGRDALTGIYRAAKIALVTPLRDGMNLVCKEYVASQAPDDPGVLILSRFAGAARQMKDALIVNPYSREDMSDAIKRALTMPLAERRGRWETLMHGVVTDDVSAWRNDFVRALETVRRRREPALGASRLRSQEPRSFSPEVGTNATYFG
jgi:trehalose 6-phosphate synthase